MLVMRNSNFNFGGSSVDDNGVARANFMANYWNPGLDFTISYQNPADDNEKVIQDFIEFKEKVMEMMVDLVPQVENKKEGEAE